MRPESEHTVRCGGCGKWLPPALEGPCPHCGSVVRKHSKHLSATAHASASLTKQKVHEYWVKRPFLLATVVVLTFAAPVLGLVFAGLVGTVIGLCISVLSLILGFRAVTRVREVETIRGS